ncbi:hypothetical protein H6H01_09125 [Nostoc calcicola FACHB-3891]|nr:hypothetical protein [Nostoc calcicola FACHB-3891]MDZ8061067.1 hypothetical protein [Nostoc sp. EkiNYC01]
MAIEEQVYQLIQDPQEGGGENLGLSNRRGAENAEEGEENLKSKIPNW